MSFSLSRTSILLTYFLIYQLLCISDTFSQQSLILKYPGRTITPYYFIPSTSESMGLVEITYDDPLRDIFTNPGKSNGIFNSQIFLSFSNLNQKKYFNSFGQNIIEDYELNERTWHVPFGGLLKWDKFIFGVIAGLGSDPKTSRINTWDKIELKHSTSSSSYSSGRNFFLNLITSYRFNNDLGIGLLITHENYYHERLPYQSYKFVNEVSTPFNISCGLEYKFSTSDLFSASGLYYRIKDEHNRFSGIGSSFMQSILGMSKFTGTAFNFDYARILSEDTKLHSRLGVDFRKIYRDENYNGFIGRVKRGDAANWKLGIGLSHQQGNLLAVGELFYEPGRNNEQFDLDTGSWDPWITGEDDYFYNWIARLGLQFRIWDFLTIQAGSEYHSQKVKRDSENDYEFHSVINPYFSAAKFSLTAGFNFTYNSFTFLYNFIYSSLTLRHYPYFNYWRYLEMMEVNPIQHRLMLSYEF